MVEISIVIPEYKGAGMVGELVKRCRESLSVITEDYEIILVNDASPDNAWEEIKKSCVGDSRVKGIDLSKNFGQHYAISAGLAYAKGEWVVVMDCDLQDRPEEIPRLYSKAIEGWDIVYARRVNKKFGFFKKLSSTLFNAVLSWLSGSKTDPAIGNFGIYEKRVIEEFNKLKECARSFGSLIHLLGFKSTTIDVVHSERGEGKSSYTLRKLLHLSADIILSNSNKPLKMTSWLGFGMAALSFLLALYNVIAKLAGIVEIPGYTSTVFSIWFVGGLILSVLGVVGLYVGRIFDQVKERPLFIVRECLNINNDE